MIKKIKKILFKILDFFSSIYLLCKIYLYYNVKNKYTELSSNDEESENYYFNKACPEDSSNWRQLLTFSWVQRIIFVGYFRSETPLELNDISELPESLKVQNSSALLDDIDFNDSNWPLIKHIYSKFLIKNYLSIILFILISSFSFITPLVLKSFLTFVEQQKKDINNPKPIYIGIILSFLLFLSSFIYQATQQYAYWYGFKTSIQVKGALEIKIFEKLLRLSNLSKKIYNSGSLVNLMSVDTDFFQFFYSHYYIEIILFPIQILCLLGFLVYVIGISGLVGFLVMVITIPLSTFLGYQISNNLGKSMSYSDLRISLTGELINGIRFLKQYAWERNFIDRIQEQRKLQLKYLYIRIFYWILVQIVTQASTGLVLVSTFTVYTLLGYDITLDIAFTAITIFVNLRRPIEFLPDCLHKFISLIASGKRIETFLQSSELQKQPFIHNQSGLNDILIRDTTFDWNESKLNDPNSFQFASYGLEYKDDNDYDSVQGRLEEFGYGKEEEENFMTDRLLLRTSSNNNFIYHHHNSELKNSIEYLFKQKQQLLQSHQPQLQQQQQQQQQSQPQQPLLEKDDDEDDDEGEQNIPWSPPPLLSLNTSVDFRAPKGKLTIISSGVKSGKTSLVNGLIGEIYRESDSLIETPKSISFTTQQPFLLSSSFRENILFGKPMDIQRYKNVLDACCLGPDLINLPAKDLTFIGERGSTLSGGQKSRIELARALYANSDCYVLDEILSSIDPDVANYIFKHCIQDMMKDKTVILVTHQIQFISSADHIVIVDNGEVVQGTYNQLINMGVDFESILKEKENKIEKQIIQLKEDEDYYEEVEFLDYSQQQQHHQTSSNSSSKLKRSSAITCLPKDIPIETVISTDNDKSNVEKSKLFVQEDRDKGDPGFSIYKRYINMGSSMPFFVFTCLVYLGSQIIFMWSDWWLQRWASRDRSSPDNPGESYYLLRYLGFIGGFLFALGFRYILITHITFGSSEKLHNLLLKSVSSAPSSFFEQNPVGRILNRFGKDLGDIDIYLLDCFSDVLYCGACLITSIGLMIYTTPYIAIPFAVLIAVNYLFQLFYNCSVLELKRIQSISRSPVFSLLTEVHNGLLTIRNFKQQPRFLEMMRNNININLRVFFYGFAVSRWIGIRLEFLSAIIVLMSALFSIFNNNPGLSALGVTAALNMTSYLNWFIRQFSEIESKLNAVERIQSYISIPPEQEANNDDFIQTGIEWPQHGDIEFRNVSIKYRPTSEPALKHFSLKINAGERVVILGRTGAGKSTIGTSLFRMVECSEGSILIDGDDISKIDLKRLRGSIGIIPQDPFLFSGSIRLNVDCYEQYTDDEIWEALGKVKLKKVVAAMPMKLDSIILENGEGLTTSQKQLLSLARAILKSSKILLLDEAVNKVDVSTAHLIKQTIEENFKYCTIITIANKIDQIIDSDKIAVIDNGELLEYDTPLNLIKNSSSRFSKLVKLNQLKKKF